MRQSFVFRDVTEMHVFAYKFRLESGVYGPKEFEDDSNHAQRLRQVEIACMSITISTVRRVERLFDMLTLQLPCTGKCPHNIMAAFGNTIYTLAQNTAYIWSDHKGRLIRNLVHYFAGRAAAERFDASLISDEELETIVLARVPYVAQLYLNEDHFVLQDVAMSSDLKADLKNKIRFIDTVLSKNKQSLQNREKNIIEAYYSARELCVKNSFIQNKNHFPDIVTKVGEASKLGECVVYLRHLIRIMCMAKHLKKVEGDDKFFQFLMQLHEALYTWSDTSSMAEILERVRGNILCYLRGLTLEQMMLDKEFTKAKLEHLEKELYRHLNYLTLRQVQAERLRKQPAAESEASRAGGLRPVDSESSIYTMAMSASSFLMQRQASLDLPERTRLQELQLMHQQVSTELYLSLRYWSSITKRFLVLTLFEIVHLKNIFIFFLSFRTLNTHRGRW